VKHRLPKNWQPQPSDIVWTRNLIEQLNEGAVWGIPRANSVWRLNKANKVFTLAFGDPNEPDNAALKIILPMIGYRAEYKPEPVRPVAMNEQQFGTGKTTERPILPISKFDA